MTRTDAKLVATRYDEVARRVFLEWDDGLRLSMTVDDARRIAADETAAARYLAAVNR